MSTAESSPASSFEQFRAEQYRHRRIFIKVHGPFPHPCHFCGEEVDGHTQPCDSTAATVHHLDRDHSNNDPANLVPAHHGCHCRYHALNMTPEHRAKISAAITALMSRRTRRTGPSRKGRKLSPEHVATMRAALTGRKLSPEHAAKLKGNTNWRHVPLACCIKCHRELRVGGPLAHHVRACVRPPGGNLRGA